MGFISWLSGGHSGLEQRLEESYVEVYQATRGVSLSEAQEIVRGLIDQAKQEAHRAGTAGLPLNQGDRLLATEATDEESKDMLAAKRREGVRDEDIRWWWNMHDLERRLLIKDDELARGTVFIYHLEQGLSPDQAAARVRKRFPIYGDPSDTTHTSGDDCPLPVELKDRVNIYNLRRTQQERAQFEAEIGHSTTFNALVRREIRNGLL